VISGLWYSLKKGVVQIFRNKGMSAASIISITAMLLILALFFFLTVNVNYLAEEVQDEFNTIEVFLLDETSVSDAKHIAESLASMNQVESVTYITKTQALDEFKVSWGDNAYLLDGLSENPLPNSLRVVLSDISGGSLVSQVAYGFTGVEDVRFYQEEVEKILYITDIIKKSALVIILFLVVISIFVVSNTIKLTVLARKEEIEIMKYIGAGNWFVRGPMFLEGMIIGLISAAIATGISGALYSKFVKSFSEDVIMLFSASLVEPQFIISHLIWIFLSLGISIGACGSIVSMRKFLKV